MDALLRRRQMMLAGGTPPAPLPYTPVDYIETDGVAYINTLIKGNTPLSCEINFVPVIPGSSNSYIVGSRKDSGNTRVIPLLVNANGYAGYAYAGQINNSTETGINCEASAQNKTLMLVRCSLTSGSQYFGVKQAGDSSWTTKHTTTTGAISSSDVPVAVFGNKTATGLNGCASGTRIEHVKIWAAAGYDTEPVFYGVACYYNGEYGLWDNVSNSFFGNAAGSGAFTGPSNS